MNWAIGTKRIWRSGGSDVKDPVLDVATASENNNDGIESMRKSCIALNSSNRIWKNFDVCKGVFFAIRASPGFNRGRGLVRGTRKIAKFKGYRGTVARIGGDNNKK